MKEECKNCVHYNFEANAQINCAYLDCHYNPNRVNCFRPKETKKIDMSVCIELGLDCEFESDHKSAISSLACIKNNGNYVTVKGVEFSRCKVRENKWMCNEWVIKPIPDGLSVILRFGNRESMTTVSHFPAIDWLDVESFKVLGTAEGWEY